jgi:demethylmenaquinone methyltransferase / 2-methoxy-6-polyprenyl-1,4-benzoquinol methylase
MFIDYLRKYMSEKIKNMFNGIAKRYDLMNTLLSFGMHHSWRKKTVKISSIKPGDNVLDCATGTGDLAIAFYKSIKGRGNITAIDFSEEMLIRAKKKILNNNYDIEIRKADILKLPFAPGSFDISCIAFGIRNVDSPLECLKEMSRVVVKGGKVVVLEFGQPEGFFALLYKFYSKFIIPFIGKIFSKDKSAYNYLPETISQFPSGEKFIDLMNQTEMLNDCKYYKLTSGVSFIYIGTVK